MSKPFQSARQVTLLASLGSTLEYYDFVIYGMMATYLGAVFFPAQNDATPVLQFFSTFAVGYFARPLGGTLIGIIGDRYGRKTGFMISTTLMAIGTLLIGFLPSYESGGALAAGFLVGCRILQGLSFGGELPGAMTIVGEFSPAQKRGWRVSLIIASTSLGALLASGILSLLSSYLSREDIIKWGWRLPFLLGGIIGLILIRMRHALQETPVFSSFKQDYKNRTPFISLLASHKLALMRSSGLTAFMSSMILTNLYYPYYIPKFYGFEIREVYFATTLSLIFSALVLPLTGLIADRVRRKSSAVRTICLFYSLTSLFTFSLLSQGTFLALTGFLMINQVFIAAFASCYLPLLFRIFSAEVRYTGIALSYNLTHAVMAMLPAGFTTLLHAYPEPRCVPLILSGIACLSWGATAGILEETPELSAEAGDGAY